MKMEISNKDKKLLVYMLAIAIVAGTYFFVAKPFMEKTEALNTEVEELQRDVNHLTEVYINKENYENRIAEAQRNYNENVSKFLGGLNQENTLILLKKIEEDTRIWLSRVSFQETQFIMGGGSSEEGGESTGLNGSRQDLNLDYSCTYADYKRFIEYIQNFDKRLFISSINSSYSVDSDQVAGSIVLSQFALTGTGEEYLSPDLSNVNTGVDNIFTTLKTVEPEEENELEIQTLVNEDAVGDLENQGEENEADEEVELDDNQEIEGDTSTDEMDSQLGDNGDDSENTGRRPRN